MRRDSTTPRLLLAASAAVVIAALKFGGDLFIPFALAFLLSFILAPMVRLMERLRLGHVFAVLATVLVAATATTGLIWILFGQLSLVLDAVPEHVRKLSERFESLRGLVGGRFAQAATAVQGMSERLAPDSHPAGLGVFTVEVAEKSPLAGWIGRGMSALIEALGAVGVVALLTTIMLFKRGDFRERFVGLAGGTNVKVLTQAMDEATTKISRYLLIYTVLNGIQGVLVGVGLWMIGVPNAPLWGLLSALLRFIPYLGPWIAAILPILLSLSVSPGWQAPLATLGLFLGLELLSNNVLEPILYGSGIGVSSAAILMAVVFWTWLWGPVGLVVATPLTVVLAVMGKYVPGMKILSAVLSERPVVGDDTRLYQRLLADDQDGASDILEPLLASKPLTTVFDEVVLPALRLAADDQRRADVEGAPDADFARRVREWIDDVGAEAARRKLAGAKAAAKADAARAPGRDAALGAAPGAAPVAPAAPVVPFRAVCLPARDALDEAACALFALVAAEQDVETVVASCDTPSALRVEFASASGADVVLVSAMSSAPSLRRPRYFAERLGQKSPHLPVILCLWGSTQTAADLRESLAIEGDARVAHSLEGALQCVAEIRASRTAAADPARPVGSTSAATSG